NMRMYYAMPSFNSSPTNYPLILFPCNKFRGETLTAKKQLPRTQHGIDMIRHFLVTNDPK
ncbi:15180_t:CDS:1, partial [Acaulospora morrowiae]